MTKLTREERISRLLRTTTGIANARAKAVPRGINYASHDGKRPYQHAQSEARQSKISLAPLPWDKKDAI